MPKKKKEPITDGVELARILDTLHSPWVRPDYDNLPDLPDGPMAIDTETRDPLLKTHSPGFVTTNEHAPGGVRGYIIGFSVSMRDFDIYIPVRHQHDVDNCDPKLAFAWLKKQIENSRGPKIFANAQYDLGWLKTEGIEFMDEEIHDVQVQAPLINEHMREKSLDKLGENYLETKKDEELLDKSIEAYQLTKPKEQMWLVAGRYAAVYAEQDTRLTLALWEHFNPIIKEQELEQIYDIERELIPILLDMRTRGLRVDIERAHREREYFVSKEREALDYIKKETGIEVSPYQATSVAQALAMKGIEYGKTRTGQPQITAPWLEKQTHPICAMIRQARTYQKAYSTFIDNYILERAINGRIHAQFNQLPSEDGGTVSGRFSSSNPNLQNIPAKDPDIGPRVRGCFLPEEGEEWMAADYANQEPRISVHYATKLKLPGSAKIAKAYHDDPRVSYHKIVEDLIKPFIPEGLDSYKTAKTINLGLAYGMGGAKLAKSLGLETKWMLPKGALDKRVDPPVTVDKWIQVDEGTENAVECAAGDAEKLLNKYHKLIPFVRRLSKNAENRMLKRGYIKTIMGRRCRTEKKQFNWRAFNRLVQGSAADQTKVAMIKMHKAGHTILLSLHDEIGLSVKSMEEAKQAAEIMENAVEMAVPFKCDVDIGPSWGDANEVKLD